MLTIRCYDRVMPVFFSFFSSGDVTAYFPVGHKVVFDAMVAVTSERWVLQQYLGEVRVIWICAARVRCVCCDCAVTPERSFYFPISLFLCFSVPLSPAPHRCAV